jgi:hypothetical protein
MMLVIKFICGEKMSKQIRNGAKTKTIKRNPLMLRQLPLEFESHSAREVMALTPEQDAERFLSKWMQIVDPYETYKKFFERSVSHGEVELHFIRAFYRKYCIEDSWSEQKYATVINALLESRSMLTSKTLDLIKTYYHHKLD